MKRFLIAASVVAGALALGAPSAKAEGKMYANPEFVTGFSGSSSSGSSLDLHVGYKDGPFFIQAVCYHPVPVGQAERSFETLTQDLALMQDMGINTIRVRG